MDGDAMDALRKAQKAQQEYERRIDVQLSLDLEAPEVKTRLTGRIIFSDGTSAEWELVDYLYADRTAGQWDNGIIVAVPGGNEYFISTDTGHVYAQADEAPHSLTRLVEDAFDPEIRAEVNKFADMMEKAFADAQ